MERYKEQLLTGGRLTAGVVRIGNTVVFRGGNPIAFIDFDFAAPGRPLEDLGYVAWSWCISSRPDRGPVTEQARQVRLIADGYGLIAADRAGLTAAVRERMLRNRVFWRGVLETSPAVETQVSHARDVLDWTSRELAYLEANQACFHEAPR